MFRNYTDYKWTPCTKEVDKQDNFEPIKCNSCKDDQLYYSDTELEYHRETKHKLNCSIPPKTLCLVCARSFKSRESLISHFKVHHLLSYRDSKRIERDIYICNMCHHIFFNRAILELHIFSRHVGVYDKKSITCPHCDHRVKRSSIWNHFECYNLKRVSTCPICLIKLESRFAVFKHIQTHPPTLKCNICHYFTHKRMFYSNHVKYSHTPSKSNTVFNYKKFFIGGHNVRSWWYKIPYVTNGVKIDGMVSVCILCREICENNEEMKSHISVHQPELTIESFSNYMTCNRCGERFVNKILYKYHKLKSLGCGENTVPIGESSDLACLDGSDGEAQIVIEIQPVEQNTVKVDLTELID